MDFRLEHYMGMYAVIAIIAYHLFIDGINPTDDSIFLRMPL
jgi:hypothetical protein